MPTFARAKHSTLVTKDMGCLFGACLLQESNEVLSLVLLLDASKNHLGARDKLLGVLQVVKQSLLGPGHSTVLVGISVIEALSLARLAAVQTVEVRALLVWSTLLCIYG